MFLSGLNTNSEPLELPPRGVHMKSFRPQRKNRTAPRRRNNPLRRSLQLESLEDRRLLAVTFQFNYVGPQLFGHRNNLLRV